MTVRRAVRSLALALVLLGTALPRAAPGLDLELPAGAEATGQSVARADSAVLPTGPAAAGSAPVDRFAGTVTRSAWRFGERMLTSRQLLDPIAAQLDAQGFETVFTCEDRICGGFDFRRVLDLLTEPAMHVNLGDFRYLLARKDGTAAAVVTSRSALGAYVHLTLVAPEGATAGPVVQTAADAAVAEALGRAPGLAETLERRGHVVLDGLSFRVGSADLEADDHPAIAELAAWLESNPLATLVLVGHSDNEGGLDDNIRLSERRAATVRGLLIERHGIAPARLSARGVGYLAPVASNATEEGRRANRRVEAVLGAP